MANGLEEFLASEGLDHLLERLHGESLERCKQIMFGADGRSNGRPAFLKWLAELGLNLKERQTLATAFSRASREGVDGIAESDADVNARTAWLDSDTSPEADEEPWQQSTRKFLVFTSAGEACSGLQQWLRATSTRSFDICVVYYGDESDPECLRVADHVLRHKGGKFPNLVYAMRKQLAYFRAFEAIAVWDDDVAIDASAIEELFAIRRELDLWALQPANARHAGKADIQHTVAEDGVRLRFVNFVEVTAPLFRTDILLGFLKVYEPRRHEGSHLVGYGIDMWFGQHVLHVDERGDCPPEFQYKVAVVDALTFINPTNEQRPRGREIDRLQAWDARVEAWTAVSKRRGMVSHYPQKTFERIHI